MGEIKRITSADICAALKRRYCGNESTVLFEVAQGTGSNANRHLDAVAMELWPSRGLSLNGIEIKCNIYDYRREAATPQKAEEVARFCDYFWIAAPKGVVPVGELPSAWGLMELADGKLTVTKQAVKTDAQPVTRSFLAAMLRAASRLPTPESLDEAYRVRVKELEQQFEQRVEERARSMRNDDTSMADSWRKLVEAIKGPDPHAWLYAPAVIGALKFLIETKFIESYQSVRTLYDDMLKMVESMGKHIDGLKVPEADELRRISEEISARKRKGR